MYKIYFYGIWIDIINMNEEYVGESSTLKHNNIFGFKEFKPQGSLILTWET